MMELKEYDRNANYARYESPNGERTIKVASEFVNKHDSDCITSLVQIVGDKESNMDFDSVAELRAVVFCLSGLLKLIEAGPRYNLSAEAYKEVTKDEPSMQRKLEMKLIAQAETERKVEAEENAEAKDQAGEQLDFAGPPVADGPMTDERPSDVNELGPAPH